MSAPALLTGCTALVQAESFLNKTIDIVGVVADFQQPLPSRGEDWTISFTICDKSRPHPESGFPVRIFKPTRELLPQVRSSGDTILLRGIKIMAFGKIAAISSYSTSWVISHTPTRPNAPPTISSQPKTTKPKPFELEHLRHLHNWWSNREGAMAPRNDPATSYPTVSGSSHKRTFSLIKDMEFDCFYDIVGLVVKTFPGLGNFTVYITDFTMNPKLYAYEWHKGGADYDGRGGRKWPGPWGQYTLQITLWDAHAAAAKLAVSDGAYLKLQNVRAKRNGDGRLEGALHGDRKFIERVDLQVLRNMDDPRIQELLQRNKEYARRFENDKMRFEQEIKVNPVEMKKDEEKQVRKDEGNKNIRCQKPNHPITPISEILKPTDTTAPFVSRNYRIYCRVIDYLPKNLADFSVPNDSANTQQGRNNEDTNPWVWRFAILVQGTDGAQMRVIVEGDDAVYLLKMDAVNLHKRINTLQALREKLFLLWGSLEERTVERRLQQKQKQKQDHPTATPNQNQPRKRNKCSRKGNPKRHKYEKLGRPLESGDIDPDSDTEETADEDAEDEQQGGKMFEACVKEYGVPIAGGWKRLHKLFGTVIM